MKEVSVLGIDLAKNIFQVHANNSYGKKLFTKKLSRKKLSEFVANVPQCTIGMEACGGAHYWARKFKQYGHNVKIIAPQFVKPYVKANKNDAADAEAIAEAVSRPNMRFVPIKDKWQQDILSLHRVRERLVGNRTALINEIRGLLSEFGIIIPKGITHVRKNLVSIIEDKKNELTTRMRFLLSKLYVEICEQEKLIKSYEKDIRLISKESEICQRIEKIPGVGPITSTAIIAIAANMNVFKNGRQFAAWLGLVPKQRSSGGRSVLLRISKRGDKYVRKLLVHGARTVVLTASSKANKLLIWVDKLRREKGFNKVSVALANKNARVIWALITKNVGYVAT